MTKARFQSFLKDWFASSSGEVLFNQEQALLDKHLANLFGYYLVQVGQISSTSLLDSSRIKTKVVLDQSLGRSTPSELQVLADLDFLPFKNESIDVAIMPHTLETVADPYHLIRQVDTMLMAEGALVIIGFNPLGCSVLRNRFGSARAGFKQAHLIKMHRIIDWLNLLGYDIQVAQHGSSSCLAKRSGRFGSWFWSWVERLEKWLERIGINLGNVYILVAKKRVVSPKPVGLDWKLANWLPVRKGQPVATYKSKSYKSKSYKAKDISNKKE